VLRALDESGQADRTLVVFLSDHGMPLPFAKTQLYYHSTHTPLIIRWPGVTKPGAVDEQHMVSSVDMLPTLLDVVGIEHPKRLDGRSYEPLLRGKTQSDRDYVVTEYNENSGGVRDPMRAIVTKDFSYIFNPWSDGKRSMATATKGTTTYRRMKALAETNSEIAARLKLFDHRVPEEMFNYAVDPDARDNLIDRSEYRAEQQRLAALLDAWMVKTGDPMLEVFRKRTDPAAREAYMKTVEDEAANRKATGVKKTKAKKGAKKKEKKARVKMADD
jgi:N-sulfoglucosamine sulfohydrolase